MWWRLAIAGALVLGGIAVGAATFGGGIPASVAMCAGAALVMGCWLGYDTYQRSEEQNRLQEIADQNRRLSELRSSAETNDATIREQRAALNTARANNNAYERIITQLQTNSDNDQNEISQLRRDLSDARSQRDDVLRRSQEAGLDAGGNGFFANRKYHACYYSFYEIDRCLHKAIINRFSGYTMGCQFLLTQVMKTAQGQTLRTLLLPSISLSLYGLARLRSSLNTSELTQLVSYMTEGNSGKIIFPYLDIETKHWSTVEIRLKRTQQGQYSVLYMLHDPRGKGQIKDSLKKQLHEIIEAKIKEFDQSTMCVASSSESPYHTCRQSKPDKISCGPIVVKEIEKRILEESLDRPIPYEFGACEIVEQQLLDVHDDLRDLAKRRHEFLAQIP